MKYTIKFSGDNKAKKAIKATQDYLGDRFASTIELFTQAIEAGEIATRQQAHLAMSFVGIQGYPVDALIEKYWPTLTA